MSPIHTRVAAIYEEMVRKKKSNDLHGHAGLDADTVQLRPGLGRDQESRHKGSVFVVLSFMFVNIAISCQNRKDSGKKSHPEQGLPLHLPKPPADNPPQPLGPIGVDHLLAARALDGG